MDDAEMTEQRLISKPVCEDDASCGVLYIATGQSYVDEAAVSAMSVKKLHPDLPVCLITDCVSAADCFDIVLPLPDPALSFIDKIAALKRSPFSRTLFLDSDTVALAPLMGAFSLLDRFPMAVAHEPARFLYSIGGVPDDFPELNTGVILYALSPDLNKLVDDWLQRYEQEIREKHAKGANPWHDQISFTQAVWASGISFYTLPPEWNFRAPFPQFVCGRVRIFHGRLKHQHQDLSFVNHETVGRLMNPNPSRFLSMIYSSFRLFFILKRS
jgi:hypothetical protein